MFFYCFFFVCVCVCVFFFFFFFFVFFSRVTCKNVTYSDLWQQITGKFNCFVLQPPVCRHNLFVCILSLYILFAKDCPLSCISFLHSSRFHYFQHLDTKTTILRRRLRRQPVTAAGEAASLIFTVPAFHTHMTQVIITTRLFFGPYVTTPFKPYFYTIWAAPCENVS